MKNLETYKVDDFVFNLTCSGCPEQYDVFDFNGNQVGYVRLRWGYLRVEYPDSGGEVIYDHEFSDGWKGVFAEDEREHYLKEIAEAISKRLALDTE